MDDQTELLRQILEAQREQNGLLKKHLLRIRFSLMGLLLITSFTAFGLGLTVFIVRPRTPPSSTIANRMTYEAYRAYQVLLNSLPDRIVVPTPTRVMPPTQTSPLPIPLKSTPNTPFQNYQMPVIPAKDRVS